MSMHVSKVEAGYIGFLFGMVILAAIDALTQGSTTATQTNYGRHEHIGETLHESDLQRLEEGETIVVDRWHGHQLELAGSEVFDVPTVEVDEDDDDE